MSYIADRFKEPSTYAAIAATVPLVTSTLSGSVDLAYGLGGIFASLIAVFAPEGFKNGMKSRN